MRLNKATQDEINFIASLGTSTERASEGTVTREELLEGYLEGCRKRTNWDRIDKHVAVQTAHEALLACQ